MTNQDNTPFISIGRTDVRIAAATTIAFQYHKFSQNRREKTT